MDEELRNKVIIIVDHKKQTIKHRHVYVADHHDKSFEKSYKSTITGIFNDADFDDILIMNLGDKNYGTLVSLQDFNSLLAYEYALELIEELDFETIVLIKKLKQ